MSLLILVIVLLVLASACGGWGYSRLGWVGFLPVGLILVVFAILCFGGNSRLR